MRTLTSMQILPFANFLRRPQPRPPSEPHRVAADSQGCVSPAPHIRALLCVPRVPIPCPGYGRPCRVPTPLRCCWRGHCVQTAFLAVSVEGVGHGAHFQGCPWARPPGWTITVSSASAGAPGLRSGGLLLHGPACHRAKVCPGLPREPALCHAVTLILLPIWKAVLDPGRTPRAGAVCLASSRCCAQGE